MINSNKVQEIVYNPGDYILREGANCDALIIVKSGQIEISKTGKNNVKIPVGIVQSGQYLGEMALLSDRAHSANAIALTKTICIKVPNDAIEEHLKSMPSWLVALCRGLVDKLNKTNEVLKRNGIVDESLSTAVKAISDRQDSENEKKAA